MLRWLQYIDNETDSDETTNETRLNKIFNSFLHIVNSETFIITIPHISFLNTKINITKKNIPIFTNNDKTEFYKFCYVNSFDYLNNIFDYYEPSNLPHIIDSKNLANSTSEFIPLEFKKKYNVQTNIINNQNSRTSIDDLTHVTASNIYIDLIEQFDKFEKCCLMLWDVMKNDSNIDEIVTCNYITFYKWILDRKMYDDLINIKLLLEKKLN